VHECREQWWSHEVGTEYLAANPYDIPEMLFSLINAYWEHPYGELVFHIGSFTPYQAANTSSSDTFIRFPVEVQTMVLSHLSSKEIGSLRLASRSFRQLPKSLFLDLIKKELPWFWEFDELMELDAKYRAKVGHDNNDEMAKAHLEEERSKIKKVNWLTIYKHLIVLRRSILGVRNRARIWSVAEHIVERIGMLKDRLGVDDEDVLPFDLVDGEVMMGGPHKKYPGYDCSRCTILQITGQ